MAFRSLLPVLSLALIGFIQAAPALADNEGDVIRLPGNGALRVEPDDHEPGRVERYLPGGGLLLSFDADSSQSVDPEEIEAGIATAFAAADTNGDGVLSALEQQAWAAGLPTRDDSLANPVQFDPNLDRSVSFEEFSARIAAMAYEYRAEGETEIHIADLQAPEREDKRGPLGRAIFAERSADRVRD